MASQVLARPFAALRPTAESAADVIAPPYDVVSTDEARALAANRPASFLHISRPEIDLPPGSSPYSDAAYERGAENLARLLDGGVLVRDREPSFYVYRMVMNGHAQTGVAFAASVAAYQADRIRRHELTRPDKENDRVRNIMALNAQTGPVLLAYRATAALAELIDAAAAARALFSVPGPNDVVHTGALPRERRSRRWARHSTRSTLCTARTAIIAPRPRRASRCSSARPARRSRATSSFSRSRFRTTRCGFSPTTAWSPT
jgi:uncharacterized protein (DUF1015 family)